MYVRLTHNPQVKCEGTDKCTLWLCGWLPQYKMAKNRFKKKNRTENPTKCVRPELQTSLHVLQQKCFRKNKNPTSEHNNSVSLPASCGLLWNYAPTVTKETAKHICRHFKLRTIFWECLVTRPRQEWTSFAFKQKHPVMQQAQGTS